jgi:hypothetical protein
MAVELFTGATGVETSVIPKDTPHGEVMSLHGKRDYPSD